MTASDAAIDIDSVYEEVAESEGATNQRDHQKVTTKATQVYTTKLTTQEAVTQGG